MTPTMTRFGPGVQSNPPSPQQVQSMRQGGTDEARRHSEGPVARNIEEYTAQLPSDVFLWAAGASIVGSLVLQVAGRKEESNFMGHWAPTFLLLGLYNKIVKVAGSDRVHHG